MFKKYSEMNNFKRDLFDIAEEYLEDYTNGDSRFIEILVDMLDDNLEDAKSTCNDVVEHGCSSGCLGSVIYTHDVVKLFGECGDTIFEIASSMAYEGYIEDKMPDSISDMCYKVIDYVMVRMQDALEAYEEGLSDEVDEEEQDN